MKKLFSFIIIFFLIFITSACNNSKLEFLNYDIIHELEFGGVYIKVTIDEFNEKGFSYGDSVNVEFSSYIKTYLKNGGMEDSEITNFINILKK